MCYARHCGARLRCLLFALVGGVACESGAGPTAPPPDPQYALLRIDSLALPVLAFVATTDTTFLSSEVVTLRADGIAAFVREYRTVGPGLPVRTGRMEFGLVYVRSGATVTMDNGVVCVTFPCPRITLAGPITDSRLQLVASDAPTRVYHYSRLSGGSAAP